MMMRGKKSFDDDSSFSSSKQRRRRRCCSCRSVSLKQPFRSSSSRTDSSSLPLFNERCVIYSKSRYEINLPKRRVDLLMISLTFLFFLCLYIYIYICKKKRWLKNEELLLSFSARMSGLKRRQRPSFDATNARECIAQ